MTRPFIPPLPSARPATTTAATSASAAAASAPSDKENTVVESNTIIGTTASSSTSSTNSYAATSASPSASAAANARRLLGGNKAGDAAIVGTPARTSRSDKAAAASATATTAGGNGGTAPTPGGRILRFGETVDSLFCLSGTTTDLHRQLCHDIVNGTLADDAKSWRTVVEVASVHAAGSAGDADGGADGSGRTSPSVAGQNLIRLCRRATARFPIETIVGTSDSSSGGSSNSKEDMMTIWILYAKAQAAHSTREEARRAYMRIDMSLRPSGGGSSRFYLAMADFERDGGDGNYGSGQNVRNAIKVLETGLERGASPARLLSDRISEFHDEIQSISSSASASASASGEGRTGTTSSVNDQDDTSTAQTVNRNKEDDRRRKKPDSVEMSEDDETDEVVFFKKKKRKVPPKSSETKIGHSGDDDNVANMLNSNNSAAGSEQPADEDATVAMNVSTASATAENDQLLPKKESFLSIGSKRKEGVSFAAGAKVGGRSGTTGTRKMTTITSSSSTLHRTPGKMTAGKDPALSSSRKPPLARKKIGGGAMRISAFEEGSPESSDEEENGGSIGTSTLRSSDRTSDESKPPAQNISEMGEENEGSVSTSERRPEISKMDIDYLLNWDPSKHRQKQASCSSEREENKSSFEPNKLFAMDKIEEESSTGRSTNHSNASSASNKSSRSNHEQTVDTATRRNNQTAESHGSTANGNSNQSNANLGKKATPPSADSHNFVSNPLPSISPRQMDLVAKSNADFLPLVSEDNILPVNSSPFVKLGVIGKGGSCKVYRALSKECNVVAIKKVKLAGMDRKTINSYANEIRLLKSLRGNPAIIQLYDSEVDLQRKAIFLVMELGEVDLNHVLQRQAILDGERQDGSCRNMNFIRLTWQQMLSAVHSIHEERIIHGDLKPANFLFVRGTLKLIDFGIAKAIQNDDTTNIYRDSQIGTLNYMSPESILDTGSGANGARMKCGRPSDVWALGCILYQMCYGRTPFAELRVIQKLQAIVNPNHQIAFPDTVDEAAVDAIKLCLRRRAEDRAPIVGKNGLLNEHWFLHWGKRRSAAASR
mmetsp:Transcript_4835/g.10513  ORF Transcript_4835/g.10513 Transcript_4835/m.10513 type:complete len:1058 (-) Transcript_4835:1044-4217(-)